MRKRVLKKSEVLREGYMKGLKKAQRIINEMLVQSQGFDDKSYSQDDRFADDENLNEMLFNAVLYVDIMKIKKALQAGADANFKSKYGCTPLHWAAQNKQMESCELLLQYGADVNAKDKFGLTALHHAALNGKTVVCKFLLEHGADVNIMNSNGKTAYDLALQQNEKYCCRLIKQYM